MVAWLILILNSKKLEKSKKPEKAPCSATHALRYWLGGAGTNTLPVELLLLWRSSPMDLTL